MRKRNFYILPILCALSAPAMANWQYPGTYIGDGWYEDDGSRFTISARGGFSMGFGSIKNDVGAITNSYYASADVSNIVSESYYHACIENGECADYVYAGYGDLNKLSPTKDLKTFSFAAGASIGWTIPNQPQWRMEAGWDIVTKTDYNSSPMFEGALTLQGGDISGIEIEAQSATVSSEITTDIFSVMVFHDFYDGLYKPTRQFIPYIGLGLGYADTKTVLSLADPYGDLSTQLELRQYGEVDEFGIIQFNKSTTNTQNVAGLFAIGASYGITENMFFDFGARLAYIPRVKWELTDNSGSKHREFFSAENLIYANIMMGIRFEF